MQELKINVSFYVRYNLHMFTDPFRPLGNSDHPTPILQIQTLPDSDHPNSEFLTISIQTTPIQTTPIQTPKLRPSQFRPLPIQTPPNSNPSQFRPSQFRPPPDSNTQTQTLPIQTLSQFRHQNPSGSELFRNVYVTQNTQYGSSRYIYIYWDIESD